MPFDQIIAYLAFVVVAAGTPGPANVLVAATGAQVGVLRGVPCLLGVTVGTGTLLGAVALGIGTVLLEQPQLLYGMKFGGAALLLWLAWKIATAPPTSSHKADEKDPVGFVAAALLQWINPKSWLVAVSAAGTYLSSSATNPVAQAVVFTVLFIAAATPTVGVWLVCGGAIRRMLSSDRKSRAFNLVMGLLLAGSVILVFM
jgi:threonine/homoserine/homoserine lactone efflux protein